MSIGQILLLPKPLLEKRVLSDDADRRSTPAARTTSSRARSTAASSPRSAYLAESGLRPTVSSLKGNHGLLTTSGNVSHHSSGNAVDISKINGVPIFGHQEPGGVTDQASGA